MATQVVRQRVRLAFEGALIRAFEVAFSRKLQQQRLKDFQFQALA